MKILQVCKDDTKDMVLFYISSEPQTPCEN